MTECSIGNYPVGTHRFLASCALLCASVVALCNRAVESGIPSYADHEQIRKHQMSFHPTREGSSYLVVDQRAGIVTQVDRAGIEVEGPLGSPFWKSRLELSSISRNCGEILSWSPSHACPNGTELLWHGKGLTVQYLHGDQGLRQNFLVDERLAGDGMLAIDLKHDGDLIPIDDGGQGIRFVDPEGTTRLLYEGLKAWDACGTLLDAWIRVKDACAGYVVIEVDDRSAVYPITVDPVATTPNRFITGYLNQSSDFGWAVNGAGDLNGDGYSDIAVGAPLATQGEAQEGAVYVFYGSANGMGATPDLILQCNVAGASFGYSVAHAGDVNGDGFSDLLVGAPNWESDGTQADEGGVFVYYGSSTGIQSTADIILQANSTNKYMGYDVSSAGDLNGDGYSDVIVGGWLAAYGQSNEGAAWVFLGSATGLTNTPAHRLERNQGGAQFGSSVSAAGDINGDGYDDVVVGAYRFDLFQTDDGAMFVYYGSPGASPLGPGTVAQPLNPNPTQTINSAGISRRFGWVVRYAGDVNGDGYSDVVTGDWRDDIGGPAQEGTAMVFHGSASGLATVPSVVIQGEGANHWYGRRVSSAGDINGDGFADVLIGAPQYSGTLTTQGAAYIHLGGPLGISATPLIRYVGTVAGGNMGEGVGIAGDVNGDGYSDVIVGSRIHIAFGAFGVYHGGTYLIQAPAALAAPAPLLSTPANSGSHAGASVANAGDVNGDGYSDVLVGAPDASNGQADEGLVYLYYGRPGGILPTPDLVLEMNIGGAHFGTSIRTAGDVNGDGYADVVIGAPDSGPSGRAYVYMGGPMGLSASPALTLVGTPGSRFGFSVSTAGDINTDGFSDVVIGAPGSNTSHVYLGTPSGLDATVHALLPAPLPGSSFGHAVATAGDVNGDGYSDIIIGAPDLSNGEVGEGGAYVYHGSITGLVTTVATTLERNVPNARLGCSVAGVGDVNGSGYFEVVVGADNWDNGQAGEGAAFVFYGSPSGTSPVGATTLQINQVGARFGTSVAEAGDVNGDGYADVVVGAPFFTAGQTNEGRAYVYAGRPGTLAGGADTQEPNLDGWRLGQAVAGGGDVDGDGFSDILAGAPYANFNGVEDGALYLYRGNRAISLSRPTRQYLSDLVSPLSTNSMDFSDPEYFGIGHWAKSHMQRKTGRLQWEVVFEGDAFSGSPITNSVSSTGIASTWTDLGLTGVELKQLIYKESGYLRYKWRCRVEYPVHRSPDGQRFSRWFYGYASAHGDIGVLPVELVALSGTALSEGNLIEWSTASERNSAEFIVERFSEDGEATPLGQVTAAGFSQSLLNYRFMDDRSPGPLTYYRLRMIDLDGTWSYSNTIAVLREQQDPMLWPNPVQGILQWSMDREYDRVMVLDATGRLVADRSSATGEGNALNIGHLAEGSYTLILLDGNNIVIGRSRFVKAQAPMVR